MPRNPNKKICGAKKRDGSPCPVFAMQNGKCRMHGGATPSGPAHPAYKHGDYANSIPARLRRSYQESLDDPKILHQKKEAAVLKARIDDLMRRADDGESRSLISELRSLTKRIDAARRSRDNKTVGELLDVLWQRIEEGVEDYKMWDRIETSIARRSRIVESERRRMVELKQILTIEEHMNELGRVADVIARLVPDPAVQQGIFDELAGKRKAKEARAS